MRPYPAFSSAELDEDLPVALLQNALAPSVTQGGGGASAFFGPDDIAADSCLIVSCQEGGGSGSRSYQCPVCSKVIMNRTHFKRHYLTHTNIKPYSCSICGASFNHPSNMWRHVKLKHRNANPVLSTEGTLPPPSPGTSRELHSAQ